MNVRRKWVPVVCGLTVLVAVAGVLFERQAGF